jgi:hypothetical protein
MHELLSESNALVHLKVFFGILHLRTGKPKEWRDNKRLRLASCKMALFKILKTHQGRSVPDEKKGRSAWLAPLFGLWQDP